MTNMYKAPYDQLVKLLIIGDSGTGKSSLLSRYVDNQFSTSFISTIGIDFKIKHINVKGKNIKIQLWDTAGQERFRTITKAYYRGAMGIIIVYDITDEKTFKNVYGWMDNICSEAKDIVDIILVGNKNDCLNRCITYEQGAELAKKMSTVEKPIHFFEISSKTGYNVENAVNQLVCTVSERIDNFVPEKVRTVVDFNKKNKKKCC